MDVFDYVGRYFVGMIEGFVEVDGDVFVNIEGFGFFGDDVG